ncbi:cytosol aminopeptidase-like [Plodia interpunctella]|uniref:cytosol aminopeptidase-like n=1 Tax=Plodia interpunctella TaxID=58824 RepID=UPI0023684849|nr:cytosol aminopeptidase-like [Plodia interpunctella]
MKFLKLFLNNCVPRGVTFLRIARPYSQGPPTIENQDEPPLDGNKKGLVVGVYESDGQFELTEVAAEIDQKSEGKLSQQLSELSCQLKLGRAFAITGVEGYSAVALASFGPKDACFNRMEMLDESKENVRWGVGAGVRLLQSRGCGVVEVDGGGQPDAAAEAAQLAAWRFQEFRSCKEPLVQLRPRAAAPGWAAGAARGAAQNWARFLADMPANKMTPIDLAQAALDVLCPLGVVVEARDREWIETQDMRAFLTVAQGSCEEPAFLECRYTGAKEGAPPVLLVAKGVTFDSGGLCLKDASLMCENRGSMAGAAVVLATLKILATLKTPINVVALIPLCENMISGQCMKVGDVVRALNGVNIQIEDTDMEGRLMLADTLVYGQTIYKPALIIDVATFTRGVLLATGGGAYGCFSNNEAAWRVLQRAGARAGDRPWRFPLWGYYRRQLVDDPSVDLRNKGSGSATSCLGAAFLQRFVCCDWMHVDVTGVGKVAHSAPPYLRKHRMSGRPTRALALALEDIAADAGEKTEE